MKLRVERCWKKETYTISKFFIDGKRFYEILEDKDRGLKQTDTLSKIRQVKVPTETAIPTGTYTVRMDIVSPKYSAIPWYKNLCGGKMPRLIGVPGFEGILIHPGTTALDSAGCLICGKNTIKGKVTQSRDTFAELYKQLKKAYDRRETITIEII